MAHGEYEGKDAHHADIRKLFTRESVENSDWYRERLVARQRVDERLWRRHLTTLDAELKERTANDDPLTALLRKRRASVAGRLTQIATLAYLESLRGTLGVDPSLYRESAR